MPNDLTPADMTNLADRTHGFVGADLSSLVRESALLAIQDNPPLLSTTHLVAILPGVRPSTMREVFVETPNVRWSDIGGQDMVKQKLRECVEWPLTHRETFLRLGVEAPRGILLYGPPGCSKTMTAKALATESGLNFLAVKGPEVRGIPGPLMIVAQQVCRGIRASSQRNLSQSPCRSTVHYIFCEPQVLRSTDLRMRLMRWARLATTTRHIMASSPVYSMKWMGWKSCQVSSSWQRPIAPTSW